MRHSHEKALNALHSLDPGVPREEWVRIGMAAKAAEITFEEFDAWSSSASNYGGAADTLAVWKSIKDGEVKAGTLFAMARAAGHRDERVVNIHTARVARATQPTPSASSVAQAEAVWQGGEAATFEHWYITKKRMLPDGLRVYRGGVSQKGIPLDGALMVPAYSPDGDLATIQFVTPSAKLNFPGLPVSGFHVVGGKPAANSIVYVCEGIGAAMTCHQASRSVSVCTFGAGNTLRAVEWISGLSCKPVIVADKGKEHQAAEIARAFDCQWVEMPADKASNYDINDMHGEADLQAVARYLGTARGHTRKYQPLTAGMLMALPLVRWRIKHCLPETGIGVMGGQSGAGKSFLAQEAAFQIGQGGMFFGHRCFKAPVIYLALEGAGGFSGRLRAWRTEFGEIPESVSFIVRQSFDIRQESDRAELIRTLQDMAFEKGVIILDTLAQAALGMEENSSEGMGAVIEGMQELQHAIGGLVLAVHHVGKDASRGLRGHSSLFAALDVVMEITRDGDVRSWKIAKNKDGKETDDFGFELAPVVIGEDYEGDEITSCVVRAMDLPEQKARPAGPRGERQSVCNAVIGDLLRNSKRFGQGGALALTPCVLLEEAVEACAGKLTCEPKKRKYEARKVIMSLQANQVIDVGGDWIWSR
jgi:putative DNA primase/helicase